MTNTPKPENAKDCARLAHSALCDAQHFTYWAGQMLDPLSEEWTYYSTITTAIGKLMDDLYTTEHLGSV